MNSLGTKLVMQIAAALLLVMTVLGIIAVMEQQKKYTAYLDDKERNAVAPMLVIFGDLLFNLELERIDAVLLSYLNARDIVAIKILENDTITHFWGKLPGSDAPVNLLQRSGEPPAWQNVLTRPNVLKVHDTPLGTLEVTFSRQMVHDEIQRVIIGIVASFLFVVAVESLLIVTLVRRNVTKPLVALTRIAGQIAEGNFHIQLPMISSRNEIGVFTQAFKTMISYIQTITNIATRISNGDLLHEITPKSKHDILGKAFQQMSEYLREMAAVATEIANGNLSCDIQPKSENDVLGTAFQNMKRLRHSVAAVIGETDRLRASSDALTVISSKMASGAEQTSQQVHSISSSSLQVNQHVNEISAAIEQLAASIREIAQSITEVKNIVTTAVQMANAADATMTELDGHTKQIGEITKVITTITQQTNLLALNATIEAARAGDTGRGFAVVAGEVKDLSRQIAASAEDIARKIGAVQQGATQAVEAIAEISTITEHVHRISSSIASSVEEQAMVANEISKNVTNVAKGSDDITQTMNEISIVVKESSNQAGEVQLAAEELGRLAGQLQEAVGVFKT